MSGARDGQENPAGRAIPLVDGAQTGGRVALVEFRVGSGQEPPLHMHRWEDEIIYMLEGEVTFYIGGEPCEVPAGTCLLLPRGVEHCYRVESGEVRLLVVVAPAGIEGLYAELDGLEAGGRTDLERLVTVAARYGVTIIGPAPAT